VDEPRLTFFHLAPHPDDESIGAPATLLGLHAAGHHVVNYPCSFGRAEDADRRRKELVTACERAGFELVRDAPGFGISRGDDLKHAQSALTEEIRDRIARRRVDVIVAPSPHDGHHGHEVVGRAARDAVEASGDAAPRLWLWGMWADLPWPTLYFGFDEAQMKRAIRVLEAHAGELRRNDYRELVWGRARANRSLGAERVFGYGSVMLERPFAELLTEALLREGEWWATGARRLDPRAPLASLLEPPGGADPERALLHPLDWWLGAESFADRMRTERAVSARPS
jgi:LmbE family N-acetylglucosaminyl deacetylase